MPIPIHRFKQTTIVKVSNSHEFRQVFVNHWLKSETVMVKPNWVLTEMASFTDSHSLRMLFEALDSRIVVTESHALGRSMNLLREGMSFHRRGQADELEAAYDQRRLENKNKEKKQFTLAFQEYENYSE